MARTARSGTGRRSDVLQLLRDLGRPVGVAEVAALLGVHVNTARFHLENLVENGQVERVDAEHTGPGRPPRMFAPVPGMDPAGPRQYQVLAAVLVAGLAAGPDPGRRAHQAGRAWGRELAASSHTGPEDGSGAPPDTTDSVEHLVHLLGRLGFAPEAESSPSGLPAIALRHCPFLELASASSDVVCPVHLGLMRGALESWRSPVTVDRLDPFVRPDLCMARLSPAETS